MSIGTAIVVSVAIICGTAITLKAMSMSEDD